MPPLPQSFLFEVLLLRCFNLGFFAVFEFRVLWWSPPKIRSFICGRFPLLYQQLRVLGWLMEIQKGFLWNLFRVVRFWSPYLIVKFGRGNTELHFLLWLLSQFRFGLFVNFYRLTELMYFLLQWKLEPSWVVYRFLLLLWKKVYTVTKMDKLLW